jgi:hypothetical protein
VVVRVTKQGKVIMGNGRAHVETVKFRAKLCVSATKTEAVLRSV